jgi:hypothetical protein
VNPGSGIRSISTAKIPFRVTDNLYRGNRKLILVRARRSSERKRPEKSQP